jgi:hypothetical protein
LILLSKSFKSPDISHKIFLNFKLSIWSKKEFIQKTDIIAIIEITIISSINENQLRSLFPKGEAR